MPGPRVLAVLALLGVLGLGACGGSSGSDGGAGPAAGIPAPDFSLPDVNPNSVTHLASVSPRQHLGGVSAWYFGHAT